MQLEVGGIFEGKVTRITKFGAFVGFENGQTGMVHISEIAMTFVNEIRDFVTEGQTVKVKVLNISEDGKIGLSMKKAMDPQQEQQKKNFQRRPRDRSGSRDRPRTKRPESEQGPARPGDFEWRQKSNEGGNFEDMMSRFKQSSDEKMSDLRRNSDTKRGYSRRGSQK